MKTIYILLTDVILKRKIYKCSPCTNICYKKIQRKLEKYSKVVTIIKLIIPRKVVNQKEMLFVFFVSEGF